MCIRDRNRKYKELVNARWNYRLSGKFIDNFLWAPNFEWKDEVPKTVTRSRHLKCEKFEIFGRLRRFRKFGLTCRHLSAVAGMRVWVCLGVMVEFWNFSRVRRPLVSLYLSLEETRQGQVFFHSSCFETATLTTQFWYWKLKIAVQTTFQSSKSICSTVKYFAVL